MCTTPPDPKSVHCPHCGAEPGKPCHSPSGGKRIDHGQRLHLVYALDHPEANFYRAEAERYRMKYPGVQVGRIICAPSRAQVLWWNQWGKRLRYNRAVYESEHGPDESVPALPPGKENDDFVGQPVSEILDQMDKVKAPRKKRDAR